MTIELSNALSTAEIATAEWRAKVGRVTGAIASAKAVVDSSERRRAEHALAAALGDSSAAAATKRVHTDDENAKRTLDDLGLALIPAKAALAAAEQAEIGARKSLAKHVSQGAMRKRIAAATKVDATLAQFVRDVSEWEALGETIREYYGDLYGGAVNISMLDQVVGLNRLLAALPPVFGKLFMSVPRGAHIALADGEKNLWSLGDPEPKAKATATA